MYFCLINLFHVCFVTLPFQYLLASFKNKNKLVCFRVCANWYYNVLLSVFFVLFLIIHFALFIPALYFSTAFAPLNGSVRKRMREQNTCISCLSAFLLLLLLGWLVIKCKLRKNLLTVFLHALVWLIIVDCMKGCVTCYKKCWVMGLCHPSDTTTIIIAGNMC